MLGIRLLKSLDSPLDLVKVPSQIQRIIDDCPDHRLGIDDKYGPYSLGAGHIWLKHSIFVRYLHIQVCDNRKIHMHVVNSVPGKLLDPAYPCDMGIEGIDREP